MIDYQSKSIFTLTITYLFLILFSLVLLFPVVWLLGGALSEGSALYGGMIFPRTVTFDHFKNLFSKGSLYSVWYLNTIKVASINVLVSLSITTLAAYSFSRYRYAGRKAIMMLILVIQMFPVIIGMVALYAFLNMLNLLNSHWGLILVYSGSQLPFNIWLTKGYLDTIPRELDEAAQIDGAGHLVRFFWIVFPLARPILGVVALLSFFGPFFDYIFPRIILRSPEMWTIGVGLWSIMMGRSMFDSMTNFNQFAAGAFLVAVPCTMVYLVFQKQLISGLARGTVK